MVRQEASNDRYPLETFARHYSVRDRGEMSLL